MSSLSVRIGDQHPLALDIDHYRCRGRRVLRGLTVLLGLLVPSASEAGLPSTPDSPAAAASEAGAGSPQPEESRVWMTVGERRFAITLTDNAAARAFAELLPLTLDMPDLNGNEKHVRLPKALPANASRPGTIRTGDLMLWGSDTLVVFYLTFDSPYSYTRLGRVDDPTGLAQALGPRSARVVFSRD